MLSANVQDSLKAPAPAVFVGVVAFALGFEFLMCLVVGLVA